MFSSVTNFKLIFQPSSSALSHNCSPDIKEKVFFETKNNLASEEKNIAQINLGRNPFQRRKLIVKLFALPYNRLYTLGSPAGKSYFFLGTPSSLLSMKSRITTSKNCTKAKVVKKLSKHPATHQVNFLRMKNKKCGDIITVYFFRRRVKNR